MHDLVHDLAMSVLGDKNPHASKQGNTGESRIHFELLDGSTESLQAFTQYPTNIRGLRFLQSDKTVCHGASLSSAQCIRVSGEIGIDDDDDDDDDYDDHYDDDYDDDLFLSVNDLQVLDLSECSIRKLPSSIGNLKLLRYLNAPGVQHWVKPYSVMKLSKLTYLSLRGSSGLFELPDSIGEMEGLMYLDLSGWSKIGELPASFGKLTKLVHLDFSDCPYVTYVSESLKSLTNLEYLNLSHCWGIGPLSENLGSLLKLRNLNISDSSYVWGVDYGWLPNAQVLVTLTKLECLNLSGKGFKRSMITNLPEALNKFTKLQHLNLSSCSCFDECTELHLSSMSQAIRNLTELRYLNLSCCSEGREHPTQAFLVFLECIGNLLNLEHLDLSGNYRLTSLPHSFRSLRKLHTLDLSGCWSLRHWPSFLNEMDSLKFLELGDWSALDMSEQDKLNNNLVVLPYFVVRSDSHDSGSNIFLLEDVNRTDLVISRLENVKSVQEACSIKLAGKDRMKKLKLIWTKEVERFVEDIEVLGELVPPITLEELNIDGYNSVRLPEWAFHLPNLVSVSMSDFPKCNSLPPLGQLPKLKSLKLERMNSISEINWDFCGSMQPFPVLVQFTLLQMESLKVWYTTYPAGRDGMSQFMFPKLSDLKITDCPNLRMKPCPHRVSKRLRIKESDELISSWGTSEISVTSSASVLGIKGCKVPMHQWRLHHHLPCLTTLTIIDCSDLSISPQTTRALSSLREMTLGTHDLGYGSKFTAGKLELPNWLGQLASLEHLTVRCREVKAPHDGFPHLTRLCSLHLADFESMTTLRPWVGTLTSLQCLETTSCKNLNDLIESIGRLTSLKKLEITFNNMKSLPESIGCLTSLEELRISNCHGITSLQESIQQLTNLKRLRISSCKELAEWCRTEDNKAKLGHIKEKTFD